MSGKKTPMGRVNSESAQTNNEQKTQRFLPLCCGETPPSKAVTHTKFRYFSTPHVNCRGSRELSCPLDSDPSNFKNPFFKKVQKEAFSGVAHHRAHTLPPSPLSAQVDTSQPRRGNVICFTGTRTPQTTTGETRGAHQKIRNGGLGR